MDEEEFDSTMHLRPYGLDDARRAEAQFGRSAALGRALYYYPSYSLRAAAILYSPPAVRAPSQQSHA
jgi:hypothetical protein